MDIQLFAIFDTSGSMNEMGKIHLQRNLCRFISQLHEVDAERYAGVKLDCYGWGSSLSKITIDESGDVPQLEPTGQLNFNALSDFLSRLSGEGRIQNVLIFTDGLFDRDDLAGFTEWKMNNDHPSLRTVAVGADANLLNLKKVSSNESVYLAENIGIAINNTIWGSDTKVDPPQSISQILLQSNDEAEENWDA